MRILFDQGTPVPLRPFLKGHTVRTAAEEEWERLTNGELLTAAEAAGFELFVTTDKNLRYQQNLAGRKIGRCSAGQTAVAGASRPHFGGGSRCERRKARHAYRSGNPRPILSSGP